MNRSQLQNSVYAWLHRVNFRSPVPDFDAVPTFVDLAEQDINLDLRARCMVKRATQLADGPYVPLPCDYIEGVDIRLSTGRELLYRPRAQMGDLRQVQTQGAWPLDPDPSTVTLPWGAPSGGPRFYAIVGDLMELWPYAPPPDPMPANWTPYSVEMAYFATQQLGPDDTDTTAVLQSYPGAYLWGSLAQSAPFLRDDPRIATWQGLYQSIVFRANAALERGKSQGSRLVARFRSVG
jgi:hypothetical protein